MINFLKKFILKIIIFISKMEEVKSNSLMGKLIREWKGDKNNMNPYFTIIKGIRHFSLEDFSINDDEQLSSFIISYYKSDNYIVKLLMIVLNKDI